MREHEIRHLPVLDDGKLVGILSDRDVLLYERLSGADPEAKVEDAMTEEVFAVTSDQLVEDVADKMADHKYGSIVITDRHGVVEGILTTVDAVQALADVIRRAEA